MHERIPKLNSQILEEAAAWFIDFKEEEVDQAGREKFNAWLRRSPEHVRAFLQISAFWEDAGTLGKGQEPADVDRLIARAKAEHNVYPLVHPQELAADERTPGACAPPGAPAGGTPARQAPGERPRLKRSWLAAAASILVSVGLGTIAWYTLYRAPTYASGVGERRSITLEDGSSVELNSRSRIRVRFTDTERRVDLLEGQALFTVAKNPARPFVVATGDMRVRAVGTEFDVYRKPASTVVTVVEGRVAVAPTRTSSRERQASARTGQAQEPAARRTTEPVIAENGKTAREMPPREMPPGVVRRDGPVVRPGEILLAAGEQLTITPLAVELPKPANIAVATAWVDQRLIFESTPLREVVEEFNRYNRQQLVIRDPELYDFHISGVFPSTDSSRMIEFLRQRFGVITSRSRGEVEIFRRERPEAASGDTALL